VRGTQVTCQHGAQSGHDVQAHIVCVELSGLGSHVDRLDPTSTQFGHDETRWVGVVMRLEFGEPVCQRFTCCLDAVRLDRLGGARVATPAADGDRRQVGDQAPCVAASQLFKVASPPMVHGGHHTSKCRGGVGWS
jgi:hypothetical protein